MLLQPDCIPCILKMTLDLLRKLPFGEKTEEKVDEEVVKDLFTRVLDSPALRGHHWETTSPQVIEPIMMLMSDAVGDADPFSEIKRTQNERMSAIYPEMKQWIGQSATPLETAVKLAITGNAVDFMMVGRPADLAAFIRQKSAAPLSTESFAQFERRLSAARSILYVADNCGEILTDKLLIETVNTIYPRKTVSVVVRNKPALNDVTRKEALAVGMDSVAEIIENGMDGPVPGTILSRCSPELNRRFRQADLIISKGGGNFDTLSEESPDVCANVSFLLLSKCVPFMRYFDVDMHDLILFNAVRR